MASLSKYISTSLCAVALACAAATASASTVTVKFTGFQNFTTPGSAGNAVQVTGYTGTGGGFAATEIAHSNDAGGNSFAADVYKVGSNILTWCVELGEHIGWNTQYQYTLQEPTVEPWTTALEKLFNQFLDAAHNGFTNIASTAMQLAVWEVTHDTGNDLANGSFTATTPGTNTAAYNLAQTWLANLGSTPTYTSPDSGYKAVKLVNYGAQDQLAFVKDPTFVPPNNFETPLPGAALMFLSALGLGGALRRKRAAQGEALAA